MVFRVEITYVTMRVDQFFEMGFLRDEVWLGEKKASTTVGFPWCTLEAFALCKQALDWPESPFPNDTLHAFKPSRHGSVVVWKI